MLTPDWRAIETPFVDGGRQFSAPMDVPGAGRFTPSPSIAKDAGTRITVRVAWRFLFDSGQTKTALAEFVTAPRHDGRHQEVARALAALCDGLCSGRSARVARLRTFSHDVEVLI